jgi:sugar-specific transcriptional regulator TrmB
MKRGTPPSSDDVLEAFASEPDTGRTTLERYLRDFPEYAEAILDFSAEISNEVVIRKDALSERERAIIETGWKKHIEAAPKPVADPFVVLSHVELANIAKILEIPRQVLTAFRDRVILTSSIPKHFAERLAAAIGSNIETMMAYLAMPPTLSMERSRKSDTKPKIADRKTFEDVLTDAGVSPEGRRKLIEGD